MARLFDEHKKREVKSLDGTWLFCTDPADAGEAQGWQNGLPRGEQVTVPGVWNTELGMLKYEGVAWYQKRFYTEGGCLRLCFGAVMTEARVYLDGALLGSHYGGFCQFDFLLPDVTEGEHLLVVRVDNGFDEHSIPQTKVDWYHYGGIVRSVTVERLQGICALYQRMEYTLSEDLTKARAHFVVELCNASARKTTTAVRVTLGGETVFDEKITVKGREHQTLVTPDFTVSDVRLWDTNAPNLYDIAVLTDTDDLYDRTGFRLVEAKEGKIFLNRKELEILGVNRHEEHPDWGFAFPQQLMKRDLDIAFDMGCNALRGSHYPNSPVFVDMLDERGMLFWSEIPIWGCGFSVAALADETVIARGLEMQREMVRYYYNHPAIIIWGMHNEILSDEPESVEMSRQYYEFLKENGGNRIVTFATRKPLTDICYKYCDMISINLYLGWYPHAKSGFSDDYKLAWKEFLAAFYAKQRELGMEQKPVVMGEFGGAAIYGHHTFENLKGTEEYQAELLKYCLELFHADPNMSGTFLWQFCDIRSVNQLDRARGYNNKGVLNENRKPKAAYFAVREAYRKFAEQNAK